MTQPLLEINQRVKMTQDARANFTNVKSCTGYVKRHVGKYKSIIVQRDGMSTEDSVWPASFWEAE